MELRTETTTIELTHREGFQRSSGFANAFDAATGEQVGAWSWKQDAEGTTVQVVAKGLEITLGRGKGWTLGFATLEARSLVVAWVKELADLAAFDAAN